MSIFSVISVSNKFLWNISLKGSVDFIEFDIIIIIMAFFYYRTFWYNIRSGRCKIPELQINNCSGELKKSIFSKESRNLKRPAYLFFHYAICD